MFALQAQGLMEIFDREWLNLYAHTPKASALYHIPRDRAYWRDLFAVLSDFWWAHVIPAKEYLCRELHHEEYRWEVPLFLAVPAMWASKHILLRFVSLITYPGVPLQIC